MPSAVPIKVGCQLHGERKVPSNRLKLNLQPIAARPRVRAEVGVPWNDRRPGGPTCRSEGQSTSPSRASTESPPEDVIVLVDSAGVALGSWPGRSPRWHRLHDVALHRRASVSKRHRLLRSQDRRVRRVDSFGRRRDCSALGGFAPGAYRRGAAERQHTSIIARRRDREQEVF